MRDVKVAARRALAFSEYKPTDQSASAGRHAKATTRA